MIPIRYEVLFNFLPETDIIAVYSLMTVNIHGEKGLFREAIFGSFAFFHEAYYTTGGIEGALSKASRFFKDVGAN